MRSHLPIGQSPYILMAKWCRKRWKTTRRKNYASKKEIDFVAVNATHKMSWPINSFFFLFSENRADHREFENGVSSTVRRSASNRVHGGFRAVIFEWQPKW